MDGKLKDTFARVLYYKEDWKFLVSATYQGYFYDQNVNWSSHLRGNGRLVADTYPYPEPLPGEVDPYSQTLGDMQDYHQGTLVLNKEWTKNFSTEAGIAIHRIAEGPDKAWAQYFPDSTDTIFNRNYNRYYGTLNLHDLPKDFTFTFTGSLYDGKGQASDVTNLSGDISYDWTKQLRTTIGGNWGLYNYDMRGILSTATDAAVVSGPIYEILRYRISGYGHDDNTQTYSIRQSYQPTRWAKLDFGYEFEHARTSTFHTFTASFRFDF